MKKTITIAIIVILAIGFGYYLYKISPQTQNGTSGSGSATGYNASLDTSAAKPLTAVPAFDPKSDRYQGNAAAKNVFIEYADYQCPACAASASDMKQVPAKFPDTVFVYRYFPLVNIHQNSVEAAVAAEAAGAQGKYWEMHDILFQKQGGWEGLSDPLNAFAQYAQQAGVANIDQFKSEVSSKKYLSEVEAENNQALGLNLDHTPTFIFNGHILENTDLNGLLTQAQQYVAK